VEDEFIGAVTVANQPNFNVVSFPINPGQAATFPWLSKEAAQWEKYTFEMLEFYYKREVSEFATAGQQGKVILSVDYDASDAPPSSKQQMEDTDPHVDNMPCENNKLRLNRRDMHGLVNLPKFVRIGGLPGSSDIKNYDVGNLFVATQGIPSNTEVGELRVRYRVRFEIPVLESVTTAPANNQVAFLSSVSAPTSGVPTVVPLGTINYNGVNLVNNGGVIILPSGNYTLDTTVEGTGTAVTSLVVDVLKNGATLGTFAQAFAASAGAIVTNTTVPKMAFIQSNGTDTYAISATLTATGTPGIVANARFTAI